MRSIWFFVGLLLVLPFAQAQNTEVKPRLAMACDKVELLAEPGCNWEVVKKNLNVLQFQVNALAYLARPELVQKLAKDLIDNKIEVAIEGAYFDAEPLVDQFLDPPNPKGITERLRTSMPPDVGAQTARNEIKKVALLTNAGKAPDYILMDGPIRRLIDPGEEDQGERKVQGLVLPDAIEQIMAYMRTWQETFPKIRFVAIVNFPNWMWKGQPVYRADCKGHGDYYPVLQDLIAAAKKAGLPLIGVRGDTPYDYALGTIPIPGGTWDPKSIDWLARVLDLERYVTSEGLEFQRTLNSRHGGEMSARAFYIETLQFLALYRKAGGTPGLYIVHTWFPYPEKVGPEDEPYTLTNLTKAVIEDFQGQPGAALARELARPKPPVAEPYENMGPPTEPDGNTHPDGAGLGTWSYWLATGADSPITLGPDKATLAAMHWNGKEGDYRGYSEAIGTEHPSILADHVGRVQMVPHVGKAPVLRWTSQTAGTIRLTGDWWMAPPGYMHLSVFIDGKPLIDYPEFRWQHCPAGPYEHTLEVRPGTTIEWWADANGDPSYDVIRLRVQISSATTEGK